MILLIKNRINCLFWVVVVNDWFSLLSIIALIFDQWSTVKCLCDDVVRAQPLRMRTSNIVGCGRRRQSGKPRKDRGRVLNEETCELFIKG